MSSSNIYLPYVYKVTNRLTNQFYIGMRSANKVVAEMDLGVKYFTSSKLVKSNFEQFDIEIIAYFKDQESAFYFENNLIKENFDNPLILNRHYQKKMTSFSMKGAKRNDFADFNRKTKSKPKEFREYECCNCRDTFYKEEFKHHHRQLMPFCSQSCAGAYNGTKTSKARKGISLPHLWGRTPWNKGKKSPETSGENNVMNRPEQRKRMSDLAKRRRKFVKPDGSWTWIYIDSCLDNKEQLSNPQ